MMINDIMRMEFLKRTVWAKVLEQINVFIVQKYKLKRNNYDEIRMVILQSNLNLRWKI